MPGHLWDDRAEEQPVLHQVENNYFFSSSEIAEIGLQCVQHWSQLMLKNCQNQTVKFCILANITFTADTTKILQLKYLTEFAKLTLQLVCLIVDSTAAFANKILKTLSKSSLDRDFLYYNI